MFRVVQLVDERTSKVYPDDRQSTVRVSCCAQGNYQPRNSREGCFPDLLRLTIGCMLSDR